MWREIYDSFMEHLKTRNPESWFLEEAENRHNMMTKYRSLGSLQSWIEYLQRKVSEEENTPAGDSPLAMTSSTFGVTEYGRL